ncbi:MAG: UPF0182 family protein, partial [Gemmatimonadota bacterium]|nr:UPF0182 family protein [Gemmatimonadota bacterium]
MNDLLNFPRGGSASERIDFGSVDTDRFRQLLRWGLWGLGVIVAFAALGWARELYTDWLWFRELGYEDVLVKIVTVRGILFAIGLVLVLALGFFGLRAAASASNRPPLPEARLEPGDYRIARGFLVRVAWAAVALGAVFLGLYAASEWETVLLALSAVPFGETDPIFGRDFSFYIFTLPALRLLHGWVLTAVLGLGLVLIGFHHVTSNLRGDPDWLRGSARRRLAILGGVLFLLIAVGHWLARYDLLFSPTGTVFGVGYTDDHVNLPGRTLLAFVAAAAAVVLILGGLLSRGRRWFAWPVGAWLVLWILVGMVAPAAVQRLRVEPSELALERDYLASNIAATRRAFGLEDLASRDHPARGEIEREIVAENQGTIRNIRLWDEGPLLQSYNQIQFFRLYYDFLAVHTDRYTVDGELRQVMLATRELSAQKLPTEAQRWVNRRLQFTHGYGVAMTPVTEVRAGGRPAFLVSDVPPVGEIPLERPEIYYGLRSLDYVIARTDMQEFNYPGAEGPVYTRYKGGGGVSVGSFFRRLLYAWQFG